MENNALIDLEDPESGAAYESSGSQTLGLHDREKKALIIDIGADMEKKICRLCLKTCQGFQAIKGNIRTDISDVFPLKINLAVSAEPLMCTNCTEMLRNSTDFMKMCIDTHHCIVSFLDNRENAKVDLKKVYLSKHETVSCIPEDHVVCRLCMCLVRSCSTASLGYEIENVMVEKCLPQLDLSITDAPIICDSCQESLGSCFRFVQNCLIVEEKIQQYCEAEGFDSEGLVELTGVQEYSSRNVLKSEGHTTLGIIKEEIFYKDEEYADKEFDGEDESLTSVEGPVLNGVQRFKSNNASICKVEELEDQKLLINEDERLMEVQDQKLYDVQRCTPEFEDKKVLITQDIEIKTDQDEFDSLQDQGALPQLKVSIETLPEQDISNMLRYLCKSCSYQTKYKVDIEAHIRMHHKTEYKCETCSFKTRYKCDLQNHNKFTHKNAEDLEIYQCDSCSFTTKYKRSLYGHMLTHKDFSEITMYQCDYCSYLTKSKNNIHKHVVTHKRPSEMTMFQCECCSYHTKNVHLFKRHLLNHKNQSELTEYQCDSCSFQTKYKTSMQRHKVIHKKRPGITMFQCASCSFKTKSKRKLETHVLTHKRSSK